MAVQSTYTVTAATDATRSAVEAATINGSFFSQASSITIQAALAIQTFSAQKGESLETFFQQVDASGIGVTMKVDSTGGFRKGCGKRVQAATLSAG